MESKPNYLTLYAAVITVVFFAAGAFYWYEYLPTKTERACSDYLWERSIVNNDTDIYDDYLKVCINSGGPEEFKHITDAALVQAQIEKDAATNEASKQAKEIQIVTTPDVNQ